MRRLTYIFLVLMIVFVACDQGKKMVAPVMTGTAPTPATAPTPTTPPDAEPQTEPVEEVLEAVTFDNVLDLEVGKKYRMRPARFWIRGELPLADERVKILQFGSLKTLRPVPFADEPVSLRKGFSADTPKIAAAFTLNPMPYAFTIDEEPVIDGPLYGEAVEFDEIVIEIKGKISQDKGTSLGGRTHDGFTYHIVHYEAVAIENLTNPDRKFEYTTPPDAETETSDPQIVNIPDANFRAAVAETLGMPPLTPITRSDMAGLTNLIVHGRGIQDLSGLEFGTNLVEIQANNNFITDVSPIAGLISLRDLRLSSNLISDVSPIAGLMNLEQLDLRNNAIADFSPLERLFEKIFIQVKGNPGAPQDTKIEGPWLWVILPTGGGGGASAALSGIDFLALMSQDTVTELEIATSGATEGDPVGHSQWTLHKLSPEGSNNINDMAIRAGLGSGDINYHVAYGSITLDSPRQQQTRMKVGSDDAVKVWLNGELVHNNPVTRAATDFQEQFAVTLKEGENVLLVAVYESGGGWSGFFGFAADAEYRVSTPRE